jgi:hypothetical protein
MIVEIGVRRIKGIYWRNDNGRKEEEGIKGI